MLLQTCYFVEELKASHALRWLGFQAENDIAKLTGVRARATVTRSSKRGVSCCFIETLDDKLLSLGNILESAQD